MQTLVAVPECVDLAHLRYLRDGKCGTISRSLFPSYIVYAALMTAKFSAQQLTFRF